MPRLIPIADGVLVYEHEVSSFACGVVHDDCGTLIIDTMFPEQAAELHKAVAELPPVTACLVTHYHPDHASGQIEFAGAARLAHHTQRRMWIQESARHTYVSPTLCYADLELSIGTHRVRMLHVGGHSFDSVMALLPDDGILFVGENLLHSRFPDEYLPPHVSKDGDPDAMRRAIRKITDLAPEVVVTSHGGAVVGRRAIEALVTENSLYLDWMTDAVASTDDLDALLQDLPLGAFPALHGRRLHPVADQFHRGNLQRCFARRQARR